MNGRAIVVGWLFLTLRPGHRRHLGDADRTARRDPARAGDVDRAIPKILFALLSWVIYSFALFARRAIGWSGRRAAWLSAIAFVLVLLNFVPVGYFLTRSHNF